MSMMENIGVDMMEHMSEWKVLEYRVRGECRRVVVMAGKCRAWKEEVWKAKFTERQVTADCKKTLF